MDNSLRTNIDKIYGKDKGIKIDNDDKVINYIESNAHYLKDRPNQFQHDDFHLENIILKDKKYAGVIDFNNYDWGDPFHDFVKVSLFSRETSNCCLSWDE